MSVLVSEVCVTPEVGGSQSSLSDGRGVQGTSPGENFEKKNDTETNFLD